MAEFELPVRVKQTNAGHVDFYYGPPEGYVDVAAACLAVPFVIRYWGQTVGIQSTVNGQPSITEYWWRRGLSDAELEQKTGDGDTTPNEYNLPVATPTVLGGVKVSEGSGLQINPLTGQLALENQEGSNPEFTIEGITEFLDRFPQNKTGTAENFFRTLLKRYQEPGFGGFTFRGLGSRTQELGTSYPAGPSEFAWGTNNQANIQAGSLKITDITAGTVLGQNLANDNFESLNTAAFTLIAGESRRFRIEGLNTNNVAFSTDVVMSGAAAIFWGPAAARPGTSAAVRALAGSQLTNQGNTLILNTGTTHRIFSLWLPAGLSLQLVLDLETNATLTGLYAATPFSVNNAGGAAVAGTLYVMEQAIPYSSNHRHQLSIG